MTARAPVSLIAVIGSGLADKALAAQAEQIGRTIAAAGHGVVCGGLGGVMEAACRGARTAPQGPEPRTVGILPGTDRGAANRWVDVVIATGIGRARNLVIIHSARAVLAVGGGSGTLSELAHAWQEGRPVAAFTPGGGWGARLAGEGLDGKRSGTITSLGTEAEVAQWLARVAPPADA